VILTVQKMNISNKNPTSITTSVRLSEKELQKWTRAASALNMSRNRLIIDAVSAYLDQTYYVL
jgi:hypothetical protein